MQQTEAARAGNALMWRGTQLALTKAIYVARLLILARLLLPDDFGLLAIALVIVGIFTTISDLGIASALIQGANADDRRFSVGWSLELTRAVCIAAALAIAAPWMAAIFHEPRATNLIRALALTPIIEALASVQIARLTRDLQFKTLATIKVPAAAVDILVAVSLAKTLGVWALVAGVIAGQLWVAVAANLLVPGRLILAFDRAVAGSILNFGRWVFLTGVLSMTASAILQAAVARSLGTADLGIYYMAAKIVALPAEVAGEVVGSVSFPLYARLNSNLRQVEQAFRAIVAGTLAAVVPLYALLLGLSASVAANVLGPQWHGIAPVINVLVVVGILSLLSDLTAPLLSGMGQPYKVTALELAQSCLIVVCAQPLISQYGVVGAAAALLPAFIVSQGLCLVFLRQQFAHPLAGMTASTAVICATSAAGAFAAHAVVWFWPGMFGLVLGALTGLMLVAWLLWVLDQRLGLHMIEHFRRAFPKISGILPRTIDRS